MRPVLSPEHIYAHPHEEQDVILWYNRAVWHSIVSHVCTFVCNIRLTHERPSSPRATGPGSCISVTLQLRTIHRSDMLLAIWWASVYREAQCRAILGAFCCVQGFFVRDQAPQSHRLILSSQFDYTILTFSTWSRAVIRSIFVDVMHRRYRGCSVSLTPTVVEPRK